MLRREVTASSLNAVAERVGIDRSTLRTFIKPDGVQKPIARVLEPILAYAERRLGAASAARTPDAPTADAVADLAALGIGGGTRNADGSITFTAQTYGWFVGRMQALAETASGEAAHLSAAVKTALAMGATLEAIQRTMERAADGASAVHGHIQPGAPTMTPDQVRASVERLRQEKQREAQQQEPRAG